MGSMNQNEANTANNSSMFSAIFGSNAIDSGLAPSFTNFQKAKVLFDYDASDPSEISVWANQVIKLNQTSLIMLQTIKLFYLFKIINIQLVPNENDWVLANIGSDSGKVPKAYIQIIE